MYDTILLRVRLTSVAMKSKNAFSVCYWVTWHCQRYENLERCTTVLLWRFYFADNNKTYFVFI